MISRTVCLSRLPRWLAILGGVTLFAAGCGGSRGPASPQQEVRAAWSQLRAAIASGETGKLCPLLTAPDRAQLVAGRNTTCAAAAKASLRHLSRNVRAQAAHLHLTSVVVHGGQAMTTDTSGVPIQWVKVNRDWEVAGPFSP